MRNPLLKQELTARQKEVLSLLRKGFTNSEICKVLNISENTVKVHLSKIYKAMDVTNRTEAASLEMEDEKPAEASSEVKILFVHKDISDNPEMNRLCFTLIENLHRFHLFHIQKSSEDTDSANFTYRIVVTETLGVKPTLYLSLYRRHSTDILWTSSQKVDESSDIEFLASQITIQLLRQQKIDAAKSFALGENATPRWWFACNYADMKMDCRCQESFDTCTQELEALCAEKNAHPYTAFMLARVYYTAITESWIDPRAYTLKLQKLACTAMRDNPYSCYSQFMMAFFNILVGNKKDAITYLMQIADANPQDVLARRILSQVYLLTGQEAKALELINDSERYAPDLANDPNQIIPKAFIYLLLKKYDECENLVMQAAYIRPESPYPRLFAIVCNVVKGNMAAVEMHKKEFLKYHPNFNLPDILSLLKGIDPAKQQALISIMESVFSPK